VRRGQRRVEDAPDRQDVLAAVACRLKRRIAAQILAGLAARAGYDCCPEKMARLAVRLAEALLRELRGG
jgi:ubiquinone biosynthesis protein COQ9